MRLRADQLAANLQRNGLSPVYLVSGDEPLLLKETIDEIREFAKNDGFNERIVLDANTGFEWNTLLQEGASLSLFSSRRLIELRLGNTKPGKEGGQILIQYAEHASAENILLITSAKIDKKSQQTKWYKALDKAGITIQIWPIETKMLPGWVCQRVRKFNKLISTPAAGLIADRVEGNMLAASQEVEKLCLLVDKQEIEIEDVLSTVTDNTRYDIFSLIESSLAGDKKRTVRMLRGIQAEGIEPGAVYGALMWEYRRLCTMSYQANAGRSIEELFTEFRIRDNKRKQAIKSVLSRHKTKDLHDLLRTANFIDRLIKGPCRSSAWCSIERLLLSIASKTLKSTEADQIYLFQ